MGNFIEIDGVKWATCNIGNSGEFAANPEDYGRLYTWEEAQRACPKDWRLPTSGEFRSLIDAGSVWTVRNGVKGRLFGTAPNQIFLPAAGHLPVNYGALDGVGVWGYYWSSTQGTDPPLLTLTLMTLELLWKRHLHFRSGSSSVDTSNSDRGLSVRCVRGPSWGWGF